MEKDFTDWNRLKAELHAQDKLPMFQERDVWWAHVGVNIGHEADGKGTQYSRPVLVVRKFNPHIFLGVPLTTRIKKVPYYRLIHFKGKEQCIMLSQIRLWESKRLTLRMGQLPERQFDEVRKAIKDMI